MTSGPPQVDRPARDSKAAWVDWLTDNGKGVFPGLLAATTVAIAARFLSEHYGAPVMFLALLLGMGFHFLSEDGKCVAGIDFAAKNILRFGVALLGLGITIEQIVSAGTGVVLIALTGVVVTISAGIMISFLLKRGWRFGLLTGGAVAICGASAALAIASVLPKNRNSESNTIFTVIAVTVMSTIAMVIYPLIAKFLEMDDVSAGIFFGATIHDVAQVVGAGYSISDEAGDTATFVKLLRVAMLVPVVLMLSAIFRADPTVEKDRGLPIPVFVIGFVVLVAVGSLDAFPHSLRTWLLDISRWCLVIAISALGMKTSLKALRDVGGQAIFLICAETVLLASLVLGLLMFGTAR